MPRRTIEDYLDKVRSGELLSGNNMAYKDMWNTLGYKVHHVGNVHKDGKITIYLTRISEDGLDGGGSYYCDKKRW